MRVKKKATRRGCKKEVWFSTHATTNVVALANLMKQFRATCDSNDEEFVAHRDDEPNTVFRMHECGLRCCDLREEHAVFAVTAAGNKLGFTT